MHITDLRSCAPRTEMEDTLFDELDFSGKTIIPFNAHMGAKDGGAYKTIWELEPNISAWQPAVLKQRS